MKSLRLAFLAALIAVAVHPAVAQVLGPGYPAPGNNSFSGSGSNVSAGGATWSYGNFNPSAYNQLYWGEQFVNNVCSPASCTGGAMNFSSYTQSTGVAIWTSSTPWSFSSGLGGTVTASPEFVLNLTPGTAVLLSPAGFPQNPALVVPVTGPFTVNFEYEVGGESVSQFFNNNHGGASGFQADNQSAFWYTPLSATPEPSSMWLFGSGLLLVGGMLRRRLLSS